MRGRAIELESIGVRPAIDKKMGAGHTQGHVALLVAFPFANLNS